jgi:hypothetical protein
MGIPVKLFAAISTFVSLPAVSLPFQLAVAQERCPLSETQEKQAIEAFHTMAPIFSEPRCVNCHGAVDPFSETGNHGGGVIERVMSTSIDETTGEEQSGEDQEATRKRCMDCHDRVGLWVIPTPGLFFTNRSEADLCGHLKNFFSFSAEAFVDHMVRDGGRFEFITESFKGTRALNELGIATYENLTGKDYKPEPPTSMTTKP